MGRRRRFAAILSLVIGVILFFPIYSFGEDKILARELLVDGKKFSVDIKAEELLKKCFGEIDKRFEDKEERDLAKNIFFITTAEIALVNHVQLTGLKDLPAKITESNVLLGVMKSDTIEGFKCHTMVSITKKKVVRSRDFFTFISDLKKNYCNYKINRVYLNLLS